MKLIIKINCFLLCCLGMGSCSKDANGVYVSNVNLNDTLFLYDNIYERKILNNVIGENSYYFADNYDDIILNEWINQGELPLGGDTLTVSFPARFSISNECVKIFFNHSSGLYYSKIR